MSPMKSYQTQLPGSSLRGVQNVIAVGSGKGGVGKSTLTVNLAAALMAEGLRVGILDADIYGATIPLMLGSQDTSLVSEGEHCLPHEIHGLQTMSIGYLIQKDKPLIWRGPMLAKTLIQLLNMTRWDALDILLIDLPPGTGDIALSLVQKIPLAGAVVVTTPEKAATEQAQKAIEMFQTTGVHVAGVIENMSFHQCASCGHETTLFPGNGGEKLSKQYDIPLLGKLPLSSFICESGEKGIPAALNTHHEASDILKKMASQLITNLKERPINSSPLFPKVHVEYTAKK